MYGVVYFCVEIAAKGGSITIWYVGMIFGSRSMQYNSAEIVRRSWVSFFDFSKNVANIYTTVINCPDRVTIDWEGAGLTEAEFQAFQVTICYATRTTLCYLSSTSGSA